ncbi:MAG: hypothetical protein IJQ14_03870 [Bacteroidales bacterium]|nr:hypothetical protein [Bacteroidales bacterium]
MQKYKPRPIVEYNLLTINIPQTLPPIAWQSIAKHRKLCVNKASIFFTKTFADAKKNTIFAMSRTMEHIRSILH